MPRTCCTLMCHFNTDLAHTHLGPPCADTRLFRRKRQRQTLRTGHGRSGTERRGMWTNEFVPSGRAPASFTSVTPMTSHPRPTTTTKRSTCGCTRRECGRKRRRPIAATKRRSFEHGIPTLLKLSLSLIKFGRICGTGRHALKVTSGAARATCAARAQENVRLAKT